MPLVFVSSNKHHQESRPLSVINITREAKNQEEVSAVLRPTSTCLQPSSPEVSISPSLAAWRAYQESRKNITASTLSMNSTAKPPRSAMINYGNLGSFSPSSRYGSNSKLETEKPLVSSSFESKIHSGHLKTENEWIESTSHGLSSIWKNKARFFIIKVCI